MIEAVASGPSAALWLDDLNRRASIACAGKRVAEVARDWVGTPYDWQSSKKGQGADCKGLLWGVARELGLPEAHHEFALVADYRRDRKVDAAHLAKGLGTIFDRLPKDAVLAPGDVLQLSVGGLAVHIAIVTSIDGGADRKGRAVHADQRSGVRERDLSALTSMFPIAAAFRWRARAAQAGVVGQAAPAQQK